MKYKQPHSRFEFKSPCRSKNTGYIITSIPNFTKCNILSNIQNEIDIALINTESD